MIGTILIIFLVLILLGGVGPWGPRGYGYGFGHGGGIVGVLVVVLLIYLLLGRF